MKIVLLTQYFPPEMGAAQNRLMSLARAFRDRGHEITVLTSLPNYPTGNIYSKYDKYYKMTEEIEGIKVIRTWLYLHKSRKVIPTVMSYITFALTALDVGSRDIDDADLLLWEYPPLFLGYTAMKLARKWNAKLVTNIADMWTKAIREQKVLSSEFILRQFEKYERKLINNSILVTGQTEGIMHNIREQSPDISPLLWTNGADIDRFQPKPADSNTATDKFIIGYAGLHGRIHNLELILKAAKILSTESDIQFRFYGDGYEKKSLIKFSRDEGISNIEFFDPVPHYQLPEIMASFAIGIVIHKNMPSMQCVRSAKMFELMAMGIPILHCAESEGADLLRDARAGIIVAENDPDKVAQAILSMKDSDKLKKWSDNGRKYVENNFNRKAISERIVEKVEALLKFPE
jgi:glycosyltransferase involved in cell wall biosynthesis